jgi:antimicrobial peptide system SdpB family protein
MLREWLGRPLLVAFPWGSWLGLARTLMALGTAGTLAFSDTDAIFAPVLGRDLAPYCSGIDAISVFCLVPREQLTIMRWLCVVVLLVVAGGWRPRWTAVPHWWIAFSVYNSISIPDGGDQAAAVLALLLVPVLLGDPRRWHWQRGREPDGTSPWSAPAWSVSVAVVVLVVIKIQVAVIYFQASVAKLGQAEWVEGTSMYYWMVDPAFGPPAWLRPMVEAALDRPLLLVALTWLPLVIEFGLAISVLVRQSVRWALLPLGVGLHLSIAVVMGLWSFSLVMMGACVLLLTPRGEDVNVVSVTSGRTRLISGRSQG